MYVKHIFIATITVVLISPSIYAESIFHSHSGRSHQHPLPTQGIAHKHNGGALGVSNSGVKKPAAKKEKAVNKETPAVINEWVSINEFCSAQNKKPGCFNDVTPKGVIGKWAGTALAVEQNNGQLSGNVKVKITWISSLTEYKCGDIKVFNNNDLKDFASRSVDMERCGSERQAYTPVDLAVDAFKFFYR